MLSRRPLSEDLSAGDAFRDHAATSLAEANLHRGFDRSSVPLAERQRGCVEVGNVVMRRAEAERLLERARIECAPAVVPVRHDNDDCTSLPGDLEPPWLALQACDERGYPLRVQGNPPFSVCNVPEGAGRELVAFVSP